MFKRFLITLALGMASTGFAASSLPTDSKFDSVVTLKTGNTADDLSMVLRALGSSVGLTVVVEGIPAKFINYDISGKPFRDVWELLIQLNGLDYEFKSNNIVVVGPPSVIAGIRKPAVVSQAPTAAAPVLERRFYNLNGNAAELVLFLAKEVPKAVINAVGTSKIIAVTATGQEQGEIATLLSRVDPAPVILPPAVVELPPLPPVPEVIPTERRVFTVNGTLADVVAFVKGEYPKAVVNAIGSSKTLAVTASSDELDEISALLEQVDPVPPPPAVVELPPLPPIPEVIPTSRVLYTINGNVTEIVSFLSKELPKVSLNPVGGNSKVVALTGTAEEQAQAKALLVTVDPQVVAAPVTTPQLLERQTYLTNANAVDLAALVGTEFPGAVATTLGKANSKILVVRAPSSVQGQIKSFLEGVDPVPPVPVVVIPDVSQRTFQLINAKAEDIKLVLENTLKTVITPPVSPSDVNPTSSQVAQQFQNGAGQNAAGGNAVLNAAINAASAQNQANAAGAAVSTPVIAIANPVSIIADARTNVLIARGTKLQISQIAELIPTLDRRLPSVNIQVRIQEISETASSTLGLDWSAGIGQFTTKIVDGTLSGLFNSLTSLAGFNVGATLNALERQGVAKRVDDSNITLDGGQREAVLKSGGELSINIVGNGTEKIEKILPYGVQINLANARVDPDGTIHVDVASKVTDFVSAPTDVQLINTTNREARTSITLKSGQTVLLGGLLTNKDKTNTKGIPFLSSIPLVGNLFKTESRESERTQILLVISANVLE